MLSQEAEVGVKCKWKRGVCLEPTLYGWCLMGGIVVNDQMEIEGGQDLMINQREKAQELSVSMSGHAGADNLAVQRVERREQGRGAVALVVSRVMVSARPFFIGRPGWVRSSAWIWLFSSTQRTSALSGGLR